MSGLEDEYLETLAFIFLVSPQIHYSDRCVYVLSRVQLFTTPWAVPHQAPLSMEFSRQEYWIELPFLTPGDLPDLGIEPESLVLAGGFFVTAPPGKPSGCIVDPQLTLIN